METKRACFGANPCKHLRFEVQLFRIGERHFRTREQGVDRSFGPSVTISHRILPRFLAPPTLG